VNPSDVLLITAQKALNTLFAPPAARRTCPTIPAVQAEPPTALTADEKTHAAGLMRINHVGEICAQALYTAQALATSNPGLQAHFAQAAQEEEDHLAWTHDRLLALGARPSVFNPLWYGGAFALGFAAGKLGDAISLGFLKETELQVKEHLESHLDGVAHALPLSDDASRAVVAQMRDEEAAHAQDAERLGAAELPAAAKGAMRAMANVMKSVAYRL
jgi:3-demethoxyubiquinol 3-hydroxylase